MLEDVMTKVVKTMSDGLKSSDKMFMELEEKWLKFEEQQKCEECEHQLRIKMLQGGMGASNMYPTQYHGSPPTTASSLYYGTPPGSFKTSSDRTTV